MADTCDRCRFWPLSGYNGGKIGDRYYGIGGSGTDGSWAAAWAFRVTLAV